MRLRWLAAMAGLGMVLAGCEDGAATNADGSPTATITVQPGGASVTVPGVTRGGPDATSTAPVAPTAGATATPDDGRVTLLVEGDAGSGEVRVELARTAEERATGLMHREFMPDDEGMLFIFSGPSNGGFWMRNTLIPLDIAYLAADGRVQEIKRGEPLNETILRPELPYRFVLEVNAGWFEARGLGPGDRVVIPPDVLDR